MNRRLIIFSVIGLVVVILVGFGVRTYMHGLPTVAAASVKNQTAIAAQPTVAWSPYGEQAITVVGHPALSAANGSNNPLPTASIAKVMTALAILKQKPLQSGQQGPTITITSEQVAVYQSDLAQNQSVVAVSAGEQLSEYQALQAMLVPSATNIADIMAPWAFGSLSSYLSYANQYAHDLGMTNTHFADASGFSPQTVSTPQDLLKLGQAAMANPIIAEIVNQKSVSLPVAGDVANFNTALGQNGIVGIKTGNTDQAGGALLYAAKYQGLTVVGITLGAPDLGTAVHDSPEILGSFESQLSQTVAVKSGQTLGTYKLPWGSSVSAISDKDVVVWDWKGATPGVKVSLNKIGATTGTNKSVGTVTVSGATGEPAATGDVMLAAKPPQPSLWWRLHR
jgi:D-alanyl-D-alanine carboxypeptidase (penicillin-binding protein 5/6)